MSKLNIKVYTYLEQFPKRPNQSSPAPKPERFKLWIRVEVPAGLYDKVTIPPFNGKDNGILNAEGTLRRFIISLSGENEKPSHIIEKYYNISVGSGATQKGPDEIKIKVVVNVPGAPEEGGSSTTAYEDADED